MAALQKIWIEEWRTKGHISVSAGEDNNVIAIRIDWDNDRHQRTQIRGNSPEDVISALTKAADLLRKDIALGEI